MKGLRRFIERLAKGSSALTLSMAKGTVEWLKAGEKASDFLVRLAFLGIPVGIAWGLLSASRAFMWLLVVLWAIAAWRAVQPAQGEKGEKTSDFHPEDVRDLLWELAGEHKGVHLASVAAQLTKETPGRSWSTKDVKALLEAAGVPTRHSVRVAGRGVAVGVHRQDIPGSPSPTALDPSRSREEPQVKPATATATAPYRRVLGEGRSALFTPDPQQPNRTHVEITKETP
ncbi:hypothetical protein AB0I87_13485 [Streptomyces sp. NPDC049952]|uniref:hypothetical protein n=1 Tax=Streptomyces sp. NPDC049952 TaxID=3156665 RepID=UPI003429E8C8